MNLFDFVSNFPDEETCRLHFREVRIENGVTCKKCSSRDHYWLKSKSMFQCKRCRFRTSLRSGTVMENSKLPFRYWYMAFHLITNTKKSFSALEFQRQIGHKRYEPIWAMLHKIRMIMGQKDGGEKLEGWVELDIGFFDVREKRIRRKPGLEYWAPRRKAGVLVMAESEPAPRSRKYPKGRRCGRFLMKAIGDSQPKTLIKHASEVIAQGTCIQSKKFFGYSEFQKHFKNHEPINLKKNEVRFFLPWVHTAMTNAKRTLNGIFHGVSPKYFQNYLNEFCYKLNRRYWGEERFDHLLLDSLRHWNPNHRWQRCG